MKQDIEDHADLISNNQSQRRQWMRARQSNAILLIGWLLLIPPLGSNGTYNVFAPLSMWTSSGTLDTVEKCRKELARLPAIRSGFPLLEKAFTHSGCAADNDPGLKEGEEPFLENKVGRGVEVEENGSSSKNFTGRKFISIRSAGPNHT
jgi:hypothetical protein